MTINIHIHGKGQPLVLFHGWGFDSQIWQPILPAIAERYQIYLVDLPGFGLSTCMGWGAFKQELLKRLPHRFALAGWSMGGLYATQLAIEVPQRVSHLVNIASSPYFVREDQWPGVEAQVFKTFYQNLAGHPQQTLQQFIELQLKGQTIDVVATGKMPSIEGLQAGLDVLFKWDLRQGLMKLNLPVCYIFGRLDAIALHKTMTTMQSIYPHFQYVLFKKAAHIPFLSHPDEFILTLEEFIQ